MYNAGYKDGANDAYFLAIKDILSREKPHKMRKELDGRTIEEKIDITEINYKQGVFQIDILFTSTNMTGCIFITKDKLNSMLSSPQAVVDELLEAGDA